MMENIEAGKEVEKNENDLNETINTSIGFHLTNLHSP